MKFLIALLFIFTLGANASETEDCKIVDSLGRYVTEVEVSCKNKTAVYNYTDEDGYDAYIKLNLQRLGEEDKSNFPRDYVELTPIGGGTLLAAMEVNYNADRCYYGNDFIQSAKKYEIVILNREQEERTRDKRWMTYRAKYQDKPGYTKYKHLANNYGSSNLQAACVLSDNNYQFYSFNKPLKQKTIFNHVITPVNSSVTYSFKNTLQALKEVINNDDYTGEFRIVKREERLKTFFTEDWSEGFERNWSFYIGSEYIIRNALFIYNFDQSEDPIIEGRFKVGSDGVSNITFNLESSGNLNPKDGVVVVIESNNGEINRRVINLNDDFSGDISASFDLLKNTEFVVKVFLNGFHDEDQFIKIHKVTIN